jgi:hypothetical protein
MSEVSQLNSYVYKNGSELGSSKELSSQRTLTSEERTNFFDLVSLLFQNINSCKSLVDRSINPEIFVSCKGPDGREAFLIGDGDYKTMHPVPKKLKSAIQHNGSKLYSKDTQL